MKLKAEQHGRLKRLRLDQVPRKSRHPTRRIKSLLSNMHVHTLFAISTMRFERVKGIQISSSVKAIATAIYNENSSVDIEFSIIELTQFLNLVQFSCDQFNYTFVRLP